MAVTFPYIGFASMVVAQTATSIRELADLSLEALMNETVTSVSKREEPRFDAAAAIAVLSSEEIAASGSVSLPDALRTVPGVNVAAVNAGDYAVSIRGYNNIFANKLLVLIDGRAVYVPGFAGVFWDLQQPMLADLDRIEVIRGPGATIWGANAVNGVINVVSKSSRETQGGMAYAGAGDVHEWMGGARVGGRLGEDTYYRVFGSYRTEEDRRLENGMRANDGRRLLHGGFRLDHYGRRDARFTWQGGFTTSEVANAKHYNLNTLGHWTHMTDSGSTIEFQAYYDRTHREDPLRARNTVDTFDITAEHSFELGASHSVIWGIGYRLMGNMFESPSPSIQVLEREFSQELYSAFAQEEWELWDDRLALTAGAKLEHNDYTGLEFQPSVRGTFKPSEAQTLWAAISRAVRTPSQLEGRNLLVFPVGEPFQGPGGSLYLPTVSGNPQVRSEVLWAYELGYRVRVSPRITIDVASYYHDYDDIIGIREGNAFIAGDPIGIYPLEWDNQFGGYSYGAEVSLTALPCETLRLTGTYSFLSAHVRGPGGAYPPVYLEASAPRHQASLGASYHPSNRWTLHGRLRYVGELLDIPGYLTADLHLSLRLTEDLELSIVGQNLFDPRHPEQGFVPFAIKTEVPRSLHVKMTLRF